MTIQAIIVELPDSMIDESDHFEKNYEHQSVPVLISNRQMINV